MKLYPLIAVIVLFTGCNTKSKNETKVTVDTSSITPKYIPIEPNPASGKIDIETFGDIKLGQPFSQANVILGDPDSKGNAVEWATDGLMHQDMTWKAKGLVLNIAYEKTDPAKISVIYTITATAPCTYKTRAGMGIGNTYAEVEAAYKKDIDPEATDKTQITVGSVYGGIIFSFTNDKASKVFLGAEAE